MELEADLDLSKLHEYTKEQDHKKIIKMSHFTFEILDKICQFIRPGVKESEVIKYCYEVYEKHEIDRIWHKPFIRFGKHTITTFRDVPTEDLTFTKDDIAYLDIGIVKNGIEGDAGKTISYSDNSIHKEIIFLTKDLFAQAKMFWQDNKVTGIELYDFIETKTKESGYLLNLKPAGHLIGSFPHAKAKYKDGLSRYPDMVEPYQWLLEIQIRHPTLDIGGFYEEVLG